MRKERAQVLAIKVNQFWKAFGLDAGAYACLEEGTSDEGESLRNRWTVRSNMKNGLPPGKHTQKHRDALLRLHFGSGKVIIT